MSKLHCTKKDFFIKNFFSECDQAANLVKFTKKSLMKRFIFCAVFLRFFRLFLFFVISTTKFTPYIYIPYFKNA